MAAGPSNGQVAYRRNKFYRNVKRAAEIGGYRYTKFRGHDSAKVDDAFGNSFIFRFSLSRDSNGEAFSSWNVEVIPPNAKYLCQFRSFNNWTWTGTKGNQSAEMEEFWTALGASKASDLRLDLVRAAYTIDTGNHIGEQMRS